MPDRKRLLVERYVGASAGRDAGHIGLVVDLLGADLVGPPTGRVDHGVGGYLERLARVPLEATDAARDAALEPQALDLAAVQGDGSVALRLAQHGEDEAHVVGLAVVEEVGLLRIERLESRDERDGLG